jgi:hypothetical protein
MSRRAQILSRRKRERERLGMHTVGGGGADRQKERKKKRKIRADNNNLGKGRDREEKRKKGLDTCKARVAPTCNKWKARNWITYSALLFNLFQGVFLRKSELTSQGMKEPTEEIVYYVILLLKVLGTFNFVNCYNCRNY